MGKEKYLRYLEALFEKSPVVSYASIERVVRSKGGGKDYTKQLVRNLVLKGKVKKLAKGVYTVSDERPLSVLCFQPAYLGLQDALSHHNLWEQETVPVIVTTRKVRQGIRKILGGNVLIRRINRKYFFGIEYAMQDGVSLPYSGIEKTFIDMVYFKERLSKETMKEILQRIDKTRLISYLKQYPIKTRKVVLSYLAS